MVPFRKVFFIILPYLQLLCTYYFKKFCNRALEIQDEKKEEQNDKESIDKIRTATENLLENIRNISNKISDK